MEAQSSLLAGTDSFGFCHSRKLTMQPLKVHCGDARSRNSGTTSSGVGSVIGSSPGKALARMLGAHRPRVDEVDAQGRARDLVGVGLDQRFEAGLGNGIRPPVGVLCGCSAGSDEYRAPSVGALQQRIERADQAPVGGQVDLDHRAPGILGDVMQRRQRPEDAGVADENVELAPALVERWAELVDFVALADVEFEERCLAAKSADLVVELFQPADGARGDDDVRALPGKLERHGTADAAGSAGHQRQAIFERFLIFMPGSGAGVSRLNDC